MILPEAVVVVDMYFVVLVVLSAAAVAAAVAALYSSFLAHDPISTTMPTIKTIQNSNFFIKISFIIEKCRIIPTLLYRVWC